MTFPGFSDIGRTREGPRFSITFALFFRRSALVECVSVLHGTCLQCAEKNNIHQYVKPCEENPRYTCLTIMSSKYI